MDRAHSLKLDALRGVAALLVLFAHADAADLVKNAWITEHRIFLGHLGVDLFFVLSGAMIWRSAGNLMSQGRLGTYAINRATRILPLYWVNIGFCVFALPLLAAFPEWDASPETIWRHLTFTQTYDPNVSRALNPVLWTLSLEATFYAAVPLLFLATRYVSPSGFILIAALLTSMEVPVVGSFFKVMALFGAGIAYEELRARRLVLADLLPVVVGLGLFATLLSTEEAFAAFIAIGAAGLYCVRIPLAAALTATPLAWVGVISYSLYVWHYLIIGILGLNFDAVRAFVGPLFHDDLIRAGMVISLILAISTASYFLTERPFMGPIRAYLTRPRARLAFKI